MMPMPLGPDDAFAPQNDAVQTTGARDRLTRIGDGARRGKATLWACWRLMRASLAFGVILASYLTQRAFARVVGEQRAAARWERVHARNARRLYRACVNLRGVYIKMGQVLSIMGTFLPAAYTRALEGLQDKVPARRFEDVAAAVTRELGHAPHVAFRSFSREPVAAASLGQVHDAVTHDGERVAVKVLYPDVEAIMAVDLKVIGWALRVWKWFVPVNSLDRLHEQLTEMLVQETDFSWEARCLATMDANFASDADVLVPRVRGDLSTSRVLTMSFMEGVKVNDLAGLERLGLEPAQVARKLVEIFYKQIFVDGFFHADPHPGNFFAQRGPDGQARIVILDLGSATQTRAPLVDGMMDILAGFMAKRDDQVLAGIERMGFVAPGGDRALLERTVRQYFEKLMNVEMSDLTAMGYEGAADLADPGLKRRELRQLMRSVEYPEGWFTLERAAVIMFGMSTQMAPNLSLFQVGFPFVARYMAKRTR